MAEQGEKVKGASWLDDRWVFNGVSWPRWMGLVSAGANLTLTTVAVAQSFTLWHLALGLVLAALCLGGDLLDVQLPWYLWVTPALTAAFLLVGNDNASFALFAVLIVHGSVAATQRLRESLVVLFAVEVVLFVHVVQSSHYFKPGWISWMAANLMVWAISRAFHRQAQLMSELEQAQAALAEQAVAQERQRIAREIHDVIAHSLTVTMLHLTGARLALEHDPREATEALLEAERLGRQSLADIRRTVGLLTPADGVDATAPLPSAAEIAGLVEQYRSAGLDVQAKISGDTAAVSLATGLGLYRIVQEALANVAKHAAGSDTTVTLGVGPAMVVLEIRTRPPAARRRHLAPGATNEDQPPHGLGIQGMVERAALLGGWLRAGPDGPGWLVQAQLPITGVTQDRGVAAAPPPPAPEPTPAAGTPAEAGRP